MYNIPKKHPLWKIGTQIYQILFFQNLFQLEPFPIRSFSNQNLFQLEHSLQKLFHQSYFLLEPFPIRAFSNQSFFQLELFLQSFFHFPPEKIRSFSIRTFSDQTLFQLEPIHLDSFPIRPFSNQSLFQLELLPIKQLSKSVKKWLQILFHQSLFSGSVSISNIVSLSDVPNSTHPQYFTGNMRCALEFLQSLMCGHKNKRAMASLAFIRTYRQ